MELPQSDLKSLLDYDPESGEFTWRVGRGSVSAGDRAGHRRKDGFISIWIDGKGYLANRLAVLWMVGTDANRRVTHIDGDHSNNRWSNLALMTHYLYPPAPHKRSPKELRKDMTERPPQPTPIPVI